MHWCGCHQTSCTGVGVTRPHALVWVSPDLMHWCGVSPDHMNLMIEVLWTSGITSIIDLCRRRQDNTPIGLLAPDQKMRALRLSMLRHYLGSLNEADFDHRSVPLHRTILSRKRNNFLTYPCCCSGFTSCTGVRKW